MNHEVMNLFNQQAPAQTFDNIRISLALVTEAGKLWCYISVYKRY